MRLTDVVQYDAGHRESLKPMVMDCQGVRSGMTRTAGRVNSAGVWDSDVGCGMCDRMKERLIERWRGVAIKLHKDLVGRD